MKCPFCQRPMTKMDTSSEPEGLRPDYYCSTCAQTYQSNKWGLSKIYTIPEITSLGCTKETQIIALQETIEKLRKDVEFYVNQSVVQSMQVENLMRQRDAALAALAERDRELALTRAELLAARLT